MLKGTGNTIALGANLHVVAVTASALASGQTLSPGSVYVYNIFISPSSGEVPPNGDNLGTPGVLNPLGASDPLSLGYRGLTLPSFSLPPKPRKRLPIWSAIRSSPA